MASNVPTRPNPHVDIDRNRPMIAILRKLYNNYGIDIEILYPNIPIKMARVWVNDKWKDMHKKHPCRFSLSSEHPFLHSTPAVFNILTRDHESVLFSIPDQSIGIPIYCCLISISKENHALCCKDTQNHASDAVHEDASDKFEDARHSTRDARYQIEAEGVNDQVENANDLGKDFGHQVEIEYFRDGVENTIDEIEEASGQVEDTKDQGKYSSDQIEVEDFRDSVEGSNDEIEEASGQVEDTKDQGKYSSDQIEVEDFRDRVESSNDEIEEASGQVEDTKDLDKYSSKQIEVEDFQDSVEGINDEIEEAGGQVEDANDQDEDFSDQVEDFRDKVEGSNDQDEDSSDQIEGIEDEVKDVNNEEKDSIINAKTAYFENERGSIEGEYEVDEKEKATNQNEIESVRLTRSMTAGKRKAGEKQFFKKKKRMKSYAETTLPGDLQIKRSTIPGAGRGVFAKEDISAGRRFGPYEGIRCAKVETEDNKKAAYTWEIFENGKVKHCIDGSDENKSNWLRYINCARNEDEQNLYAFQFGDDIFYRTKKPISAGTELLIWYGEQYGEDLGIDVAADEEVSHGFACKACNIAFSTRLRLYTHLKHCQKKHENPLITPSAAAPSRSLFGNIRSFSRPYACSLCDYPQHQLNLLNNHILSEHPEAETFTCEFCGKVFALKLSHYLHRRTHFNGGSFNCPLCGKYVKIRIKLFDHIGTHSGGRLFSCSGCSQITTHDRIEEVLTQNNSSDNPIAYSCDYCAKNYTLEELYATHYGVYDNFTRCHQCEECGQRYDNRYKLRDHMKKHSVAQENHDCETCGKSYTTLTVLKHHVKKCKKQNKQEFPCDQCNKTYRSYSGLKGHYLMHAGVKPYVCNECGKAFRTDAQILVHKRVHTGEKPHTCDICNQSFSQSCSLARHRRIHTGEKPYKCKLCDEGFRQGSLLKYHMRRKHQGETADEE